MLAIMLDTYNIPYSYCLVAMVIVTIIKIVSEKISKEKSSTITCKNKGEHDAW